MSCGFPQSCYLFRLTAINRLEAHGADPDVSLACLWQFLPVLRALRIVTFQDGCHGKKLSYVDGRNSSRVYTLKALEIKLNTVFACQSQRFITKIT